MWGNGVMHSCGSQCSAIIFKDELHISNLKLIHFRIFSSFTDPQRYSGKDLLGVGFGGTSEGTSAVLIHRLFASDMYQIGLTILACSSWVSVLLMVRFSMPGSPASTIITTLVAAAVSMAAYIKEATRTLRCMILMKH
jgi:hypothetical protein